jgi:serine/threonine-protein kinase
MAPEQFEGGPVTVRSDLYSLGLVLYELYTGRRPFEATSIAEWKSRHTQSTPTLRRIASSRSTNRVERAILRCLEKDPLQRPASARRLAAALPGGDPLAAALAAGETPSPEMVAASGGEGALAPRVAWTLALGLLLAIGAVFVLSPFSGDLGPRGHDEESRGAARPRQPAA